MSCPNDNNYGNANVAAFLPTYGGNIAGNKITGSLYSPNQPFITSVGPLTGLTTTGNIRGYGYIKVTANIDSTDGNLNLYNGNIIANGGIVTSGQIFSGTQVVGNLLLGNTASIGGNVIGNSILANGYYWGNGVPITFGSGNYGNSNVAAFLPTYGGDILVHNISATGQATVTGNITGANLITSGYNGNITGANNIVACHYFGATASVCGSVTANTYYGDGSHLTGINANQLSGNMVGNINANTFFIDNLTGLTVTGNVTADYYFGNISQATGVPFPAYGNSIAIGYQAGLFCQGPCTVAVGSNAGSAFQKIGAVAVGKDAGAISQFGQAVAIGNAAGFVSQGAYAVAVGYRAGYSTQGNNSIVLNASGAQLCGTTANAFYVNPIRAANSASMLYYCNASKEVTYGNVPSTYGNANVIALLDSGNLVTPIITSGNLTAGNTVINGNLRVNGNANVIGNITSLDIINIVTDNLVISLANNQTGININGSGMIAGNTAEAQFLYCQPAQTWNTNLGISAVGNVYGNNIIDGAGGGLIHIGTATKLTANATGAYAGTCNNGVRVTRGSGTNNGVAICGPSLNITTGTTGNHSALFLACGTFYNAGNISTQGNISANYYFGNARFLSCLPVSYGNANVESLLESGNLANNIITSGTITGGQLRTSATSIGLGSCSATFGQQSGAIAIGVAAGHQAQGYCSIAIGKNAGRCQLGCNAIAIGTCAARKMTGPNSIIVGHSTGQAFNTATNTITLNATGSCLTANVACTFKVAPIRNCSANIANILYYNTASKEITYSNTLSLAGNITGNNISVTGFIKAGGNISAAGTLQAGSNLSVAGNIRASTYISATGSLYGVGISIFGTTYAGTRLCVGHTAGHSISAGGNVLVCSASGYFGKFVSVTGDIFGGFLHGDGSNISNVTGNYGNANVEALLSSGNVTTPIITTGNINGNIITGGGGGGLVSCGAGTGLVGNTSAFFLPACCAAHCGAGFFASDTGLGTTIFGSATTLFTGNGCHAFNFDSTGNLTTPGDLLPATSNAFSLGSITNQWKDLFVSNTTIFMGGLPISTIGSGNTATLTFNCSPVLTANSASDLSTTGNITASSYGLNGTTGGLRLCAGLPALVANIANNCSPGFYAAPCAVYAYTGQCGGAVDLWLGSQGFAVVVDTNGNVYSPGIVSAAGNIYGGKLFGCGAGITGLISSGNSISNGGSNVSIPSPCGPVTLASCGFNVGKISCSVIALGRNAGETNQGGAAVAVGIVAGQNCQSPGAIAIGCAAGQNSQLNNSIAIGVATGKCNQGFETIAIGTQAGQINQHSQGIAIGTQAGLLNQGCFAIAIGKCAGAINQAASSIVLSATSGGLAGPDSGFYVNPIRCHSSANITAPVGLGYCTTTKEIVYGLSSGGGCYGNANVEALLSSGNVANNIITTGNITATSYGIPGTTGGLRLCSGMSALVANTAIVCSPGFYPAPCAVYVYGGPGNGTTNLFLGSQNFPVVLDTNGNILSPGMVSVTGNVYGSSIFGNVINIGGQANLQNAGANSALLIAGSGNTAGFFFQGCNQGEVFAPQCMSIFSCYASVNINSGPHTWAFDINNNFVGTGNILGFQVSTTGAIVSGASVAFGPGASVYVDGCGVFCSPAGIILATCLNSGVKLNLGGGGATVTGTVHGTEFFGSGAGLTCLPAVTQLANGTSNVSVFNNGNVAITANTTNTWDFTTTGNLVLPSTNLITSAPTPTIGTQITGIENCDGVVDNGNGTFTILWNSGDTVFVNDIWIPFCVNAPDTIDGWIIYDPAFGIGTAVTITISNNFGAPYSLTVNGAPSFAAGPFIIQSPDYVAGGSPGPIIIGQNGAANVLTINQGNIAVIGNLTTTGNATFSSAPCAPSTIFVNGTSYNSQLSVTDVGDEHVAQILVSRASADLQVVTAFAYNPSNCATVNVAVTNGQVISSMEFLAQTGTQYGQFGQIDVYAASTGTITDGFSNPGAMSFNVTPDGSTSPSQVLFLDQDLSATFSGNIVTGSDLNVGGNVFGAFLHGCGANITGVGGSYGNADVTTLLSSGTVSTNILTTGKMSATGISTSAVIYNNLPAFGTVSPGYRAYIIDGYPAPTFHGIVTTGGSGDRGPVFWDGTNWRWG